jgi:hypothetical protein
MKEEEGTIDAFNVIDRGRMDGEDETEEGMGERRRPDDPSYGG